MMRILLFLFLFISTSALPAQNRWCMAPEIGFGNRAAVRLPHHLFGTTSNVQAATGSGQRFNRVGVNVGYNAGNYSFRAGLAYMRIGYHLKFHRSAWYSSLQGPYFYEGDEELSGNLHALCIPASVSYTRTLKKYIILGAFAEGAWMWSFSHSANHEGNTYSVRDNLFFSTIAAGPVIGCKLEENGASVELRPGYNYLFWQQQAVFEYSGTFSLSFSVVFPLGAKASSAE
jgi:hypothetical protein